MTREQVNDAVISSQSRHILCELPTSFGKTRIAIEYMGKKNITDKILIVIPRNVLIDNWKKEFIKWGKGDMINKVTFVTYISFPKKAGKWNLVIFDECHHLSERCRDSIKYFSIKRSLFLSATVKRDMREYLKKLFHDLESYNVPIREATREGVLPEPTVYLVPLTLDNTRTDFTIIKNRGKGKTLKIEYKDKWKYIKIKDREIMISCTQQQYYNELTSFIEWCRPKIRSEIFKNIFLRKSGERLKWLSDNKTALVFKILQELKNERTITFCNSILQTEVLGSYCINSKNKYAGTFLNDFNKGKINHITACDMLNEGINLVNCRIGIYASLNSSERVIKQKLGRILRHESPIIIIPYFVKTRDEEIVRKMCEDYNKELIRKVTPDELEREIKNY